MGLLVSGLQFVMVGEAWRQESSVSEGRNMSFSSLCGE